MKNRDTNCQGFQLTLDFGVYDETFSSKESVFNFEVKNVVDFYKEKKRIEVANAKIKRDAAIERISMDAEKLSWLYN